MVFIDNTIRLTLFEFRLGSPNVLVDFNYLFIYGYVKHYHGSKNQKYKKSYTFIHSFHIILT